jgi:hypothetical protein
MHTTFQTSWYKLTTDQILDRFMEPETLIEWGATPIMHYHWKGDLLVGTVIDFFVVEGFTRLHWQAVIHSVNQSQSGLGCSLHLSQDSQNLFSAWNAVLEWDELKGACVFRERYEYECTTAGLQGLFKQVTVANGLAALQQQIAQNNTAAFQSIGRQQA